MNVYHGSYTRTVTVEEITKSIVAAIAESGIDRLTAINLFYKSDTFSHLADRQTSLYRKTWQEIYQMLQREFQNSKEQ